MTGAADRCLRCGIDCDPCPYCAVEQAGGRLGLAPGGQPEPALPRGGLRAIYSALTEERRRPGLGLPSV